jgi:hypothetical protein
MECTIVVIDRRCLPKCGRDATRRAFVEQHRDDLRRRTVTEKLPERFLVPSDAMTIDQGDEVGWSETAEGGLRKMRVGGQEILGGRADIGEIAPSAAGYQNFAAGFWRMVDQQDSPAPLSR